MSELPTAHADDHGLAAALELARENFSRRTGIRLPCAHRETAGRPALQVEIALFRIAQEALNNVAKHARARRVEIALDHANGRMRDVRAGRRSRLRWRGRCLGQAEARTRHG